MEYKEGVKCDICGKSFYSKKQLEQHTKDRHSTVGKRKPVKKPFKLTIIGVGALVAIIAVKTYVYVLSLCLPLRYHV